MILNGGFDGRGGGPVSDMKLKASEGRVAWRSVQKIPFMASNQALHGRERERERDNVSSPTIGEKRGIG
jgi:hypothetical protein